MPSSREPTGIHSVTAPVYAAMCYVIQFADGDCVIVDAGAGVAAGVKDVIAANRLHPQAVLATHGHGDHTWDAGALCQEYGIPLVIHEADAYRLADPFRTIENLERGRQSAFRADLIGAGIEPKHYLAPSTLLTITPDHDMPRQVPGLATPIRALHVPGHTEGSVFYFVGDTAEGEGTILSGDVLFAGTIGRCDLPGGDPAAMEATLRDVVAHLDPAWKVLPGHGPATWMGRELVANPFVVNPSLVR